MRVTNPRLLGKKFRCPKCSEPFVATVDSRPNPTAPVKAAASRRVTALKRRTRENGRDDGPEVDDEYGGPAQPLGDPRDKPKRATQAASEPPAPEEKPRKKKRKKSRGVPEPSGLRMFCYGFIGGSLGGIVWVAIACFLKVHLGIIAILVGVLTGIGVQTGNSGADDHGPGEIAVFTAFAVILACKVVVACLLIEGPFLGAESILKTFTPYDFVWCAIAGRWAYRVASGGLF
jgi:hypothetical protein